MSTLQTEDTAAPRRLTAVEDQPFWDAIDTGEFCLARCACGAHYARTQACLACGAAAGSLRWGSASGRGKVRSFIVFDKAYHPYFTDRVPYVVAVVTLEEGPDIVTNVIGAEVDAVTIGMPVRIVITERGGQNIHQASAAP